jgi:hypothetical protein
MADSKHFSLPINGDYEVRIEYSEDFVIFHLPYIAKMTPGVYKDMVIRLEDFWEFAQTVGYKAIFGALDPNNTKMERLVEMLGFKFFNYGDGLKVFIYMGDK